MMIAGEISELTAWNKRIGVIKGWPTPCARLGTQRGPQAKRYTDPRRSNDLDDAVAYFGNVDSPPGVNLERETFPTPMARDYKSGSVSDATKNKNSRPLSEYVKGQLNPDWVSWLMGFPKGWV